MKFNRLIIFVVLFLIVITMGMASANDLSDNNVNATSGSDDYPLSDNVQFDDSELEVSQEIVVNDWTELRDYCSLNDKNYVLKLKENTNYYPEDPTSDDYQIIINNNVTIRGSYGAYIGDSSPDARVITYAPIKVNDKSGIGISLQNITFKWINTKYKEDGVFLTLGGNVNSSIKDCSFLHVSTNNGHSSIIHIKYGTLEASNCTFVNCTTDYGCISVYCPEDSSTSMHSGAEMFISDSYFENNCARTEPGCINNCGVLTVSNTTFTRNSAFWWAGAIHTHSRGQTTIYDSSFTENVAGWNGGALYTYGMLKIFNSSFIGNNCSTNNGGGAIGAWNYGSIPYIYIEGCLFKYNENLCWGADELSSSAGHGGAISATGISTFEVFNSTFIENSASLGTAIYVASNYQNGGSLKIIGNQFINHTRVGDALVISINANMPCEIRDNSYYNDSVVFSKLKISCDEPVCEKVTFYIDAVLDNPKSYDGDILEKSGYNVYVDGAYNTTVYSSNFTLDIRKGDTHRVYVVPSISNTKSNEVLAGIARTYIYVSKKFGSDANDGLTRDTPVATLNKSIELARSHENIIIMDGTFNEVNLKIDYNLTITAEDNVIITSKGSIFEITDGDMFFKNIVFRNNKLSDSGKTKETIIKYTGNGFLNIENCTFEGNEYGSLIDASSSVEGENLKFINNKGALISADSIALSDSLFEGNILSHTVFDSLLILSGKNAKFQIENSAFKNNSVLSGCIKSSKGNFIIKYCNFSDNQVLKDNRASCIYNTGGSIEVSSSIFINNKADYSRSSVIYVSGGTTYIKDSIMINNLCGGGIINGNDALRSVTCNYNWWGNTLENLTKPQLNSLIVCNKWLVLNVTSSHEVLGMGEVATVLFDLNYAVDGQGNISDYFGSKLPSFEMEIKTVNGNSPDKVKLIDSRAEVPFELTQFTNASLSGIYYTVKTTIEFYVTQINPNFIISVKDIEIGQDAEITVRTKSKINSVVISVDGNYHTLNFVNGVSKFSVSRPAIGIHQVKLNYTGTALYCSSLIIESFEVYGIEPHISIEVADSYYGDDVKVTIYGPNDAEGDVNVTLNGTSQLKPISNGNVEFIFSGLTAGDYLIFSDYLGDSKYVRVNKTADVKVLKHNSTTSISVGETVLGHDVILTVNINEDATGNVTFIINGDSKTEFFRDAEATHTIHSISKGDYTVEAIYNGDEKYLPSRNLLRFSIGKLNSTINAIAEDINYGENATVRVMVNSNAKGNITVIIDGKSKTVELVGGNADVNFSGLNAGEKIANITYSGDEDYLSSNHIVTFNISKISPSFIVSANSAMVGKDVSVKIYFDKNMTGNFTFRIDDAVQTYKIFNQNVREWIVKNLNPGNYTVRVVYNGDYNYNSDSNSTNFTIYEYPLPQVSNEGIDAENTDASQFESISNGNIIHTIDLKNKINGSIVIDSEGNIYFASDNQLFAYSSSGKLIWNYSSDMVGEGSFAGVSIGRDFLISPMNGNKLFFINITSGKEISNSNIFQASSLFSPIIDENYNVYIAGEYQHYSNDYKLVIVPYSTWQTGATPTMIGIGNSKPVCAPIIVDNETVAVVTESGLKIVNILSGNIVASLGFIHSFNRPVAGVWGDIYACTDDSIVAIYGGEQQWRTRVTGGIGKYLALDSQRGYLYSANINGVLYKYDISNGEEYIVHDFKECVSSNVVIDSEGNLYLGTESGKFYALDCEGNVLWKVNLNSSVTGNPIIDKDGFIYVIVNQSKIVKLGFDELADPNLDVAINNITIGDNLSIEISFDDEITGLISVEIDNMLYNSTYVYSGDRLTFSILNLSSGNHTAKITYSGDKKFGETIKNIKFSVFKQHINLKVHDLEIYMGSDPIFDLDIPEDANGNVSVIIDGTCYNGTVNNCKIRINASDLSNGTYDVILKFYGNDKYLENETVSLLVVLNKVVPDGGAIDISDSADTNLSYSIDLENATGSLTVFVDNVVYKTVNLVKGSARINVVDLPYGTHEIKIVYSGDEKYSSLSKSAVVNIHEPVISIIASDLSMFYTSGAKFKAQVTIDNRPIVGKTVTFIIDGKKLTASTDKNGYASVKIDLPPKSTKYLVSVEYQGVKTQNNVKVNSILSAKNLKVKKSAKSLKIKVSLKKVNGKYLKSKKLTLKFNGKKYDAKTNKKGVVTFKLTKKVIKKLKAGKKYSYQVIYLKDTVKKIINVKK